MKSTARQFLPQLLIPLPLILIAYWVFPLPKPLMVGYICGTVGMFASMVQAVSHQKLRPNTAVESQQTRTSVTTPHFSELHHSDTVMDSAA